ncbi:MAG: hypothetical protein B7X60_01660 [Polynucleobacter sp. 39-45-136]|jgi:hypothetical protein|nr:MAG: hypothetical protein B7X60_01660 [Polynucleobacter sp. 39-45-136]
MAFYASDKVRLYKWLCHVISPIKIKNDHPEKLPACEGDWGKIIHLGSVNGVLPMLYSQLKNNNQLALLPPDLSLALEGFYELNCLFNKRLREQIISTTRLLNHHNINPIWLKGSSNLLAPDWTSSTRTMLDLDLWIPDANDQRSALKILEIDGYRSQSDTLATDYLSHHHYAPLFKVGEPARLELHRHIVSPRCFSLLPDGNSFKNVKWVAGDINFGTLALNEQIMQSYLQCTEQSTDLLCRPRSTIKIMKIVDFLQRLSSKGISFSEWMTENPALMQEPWRVKAQDFSSFLHEFFFIDIPVKNNKKYLRKIAFAIQFQKIELAYYIAKHGLRLILSGDLKSIDRWRIKINQALLLLRK